MTYTASACPERVDLKGVKVYPFASADALIDYADSKRGILVAVNAEKMLNATDQTRDIINSNIAYCDGSEPCLPHVRKEPCPQTRLRVASFG